MQNCLNNSTLVLKVQLTGTSINQKYQQKEDQYLGYIIDSSFQGVM